MIALKLYSIFDKHLTYEPIRKPKGPNQCGLSTDSTLLTVFNNVVFPKFRKANTSVNGHYDQTHPKILRFNKEQLIDLERDDDDNIAPYIERYDLYSDLYGHNPTSDIIISIRVTTPTSQLLTKGLLILTT